MTEEKGTVNDNNNQDFCGDNTEEPTIKGQFQPAY